MPLTLTLLLVAFVIIACILCNKLSAKVGVPMLLAFILLGMVFGSDGLFHIKFENFEFVEQFCTIALIFIIFYGGFGTNWKEAKKIAKQSLLLSSAGVILTAFFVGMFCHFVLKIQWYEGLLIGAVLGSTDAASVFSLLRSKKLNLKYGTASMLELESGSNDPWAYMMTILLLEMISHPVGMGSLFSTLFSQVFFGVLFGILVSLFSLFVFSHFQFEDKGFDSIFLVAVAILSYALPSYFGGNGYLSAYIVGIVLGNQKIPNKKALVHFFDGTTGLMQMFIFFLLGLLAFPSQMKTVIGPALLIFLFLSLIARPAAVFLILSPFQAKLSQKLMVSWAGLRGATSIVFAIMVQVSSTYSKYDVFHIAFCIVLLSIAIQGTLLPWVAKKLQMIDDNENVMKTFNDYSNETKVSFLQTQITSQHPWVKQEIRTILLPSDIRIAVIFRNGNKIIPKGNTCIENGDKIILSTTKYTEDRSVELYELPIDKNHSWCDKKISELSLPHSVIVFMKRKDEVILPSGEVTIKADDILVILDD